MIGQQIIRRSTTENHVLHVRKVQNLRIRVFNMES